MESGTPIYRGMSWDTKYPKQQEAYGRFMAQVDDGYFDRATFESYSTDAGMVLDKYMTRPTKVFITVVKHGNAKYIGKLVELYYPQNGYEKEVLFSKGGKMKILKKEVRDGILYLTVEEVQ